MEQNTNISIIQLIKSGEISVDYEISRLKAGHDINVHIRTYLRKSDHYQAIKEHIQETEADIERADSTLDKLHFDKKLQHLYKVEKDFICNTIYLAGTLSDIQPRTERLKKAIMLFEEAKINEADVLLAEEDLLNDQHNLLAFVIYQKNKIINLENDIKIEYN